MLARPDPLFQRLIGREEETVITSENQEIIDRLIEETERPYLPNPFVGTVEIPGDQNVDASQLVVPNRVAGEMSISVDEARGITAEQIEQAANAIRERGDGALSEMLISDAALDTMRYQFAHHMGRWISTSQIQDLPRVDVPPEPPEPPRYCSQQDREGMKREAQRLWEAEQYWKSMAQGGGGYPEAASRLTRARESLNSFLDHIYRNYGPYVYDQVRSCCGPREALPATSWVTQDKYAQQILGEFEKYNPEPWEEHCKIEQHGDEIIVKFKMGKDQPYTKEAWYKELRKIAEELGYKRRGEIEKYREYTARFEKELEEQVNSRKQDMLKVLDELPDPAMEASA
jgi:hypothetical protein